MTSLITIYAFLLFAITGNLLMTALDKWTTLRSSAQEPTGVSFYFAAALYILMNIVCACAAYDAGTAWEAHVQPAIEAAQPVEAANPDTDNNHAN